MKPMTKEDQFEGLPAADKQAIIRAHQEEVEWYGNCTHCGARVTGKLRELRGRPCPKCGAGAQHGR